MKKVLHFLASNQYSGAENVICTIIENFKDEFEMAYCSPMGPIDNILQNKNIKHLVVNKFDVKNLKKNIKEFNPDIIHAHDYKASLLVAMTGFKGKIISHLHINAEFARKWNIKSILYFLSIKKYDKVIGVSNSVLEEAVFKNKMKHKYMTLYNYVNKEQIIKKANEYNFKKKYDLFFFGRLNELKNPKEFIEIVRNLKEKDKNISGVDF